MVESTSSNECWRSAIKSLEKCHFQSCMEAGVVAILNWLNECPTPEIISKHRSTLSFFSISLWMIRSAKMQFDSRLLNNSCQRCMVKIMHLLVIIIVGQTKVCDVMGCFIAIKWMYLVNLSTTTKIKSLFGSGRSKQ